MMMIIWNRASSKLLFKLDWTFKDSMVEFHIHHGIKMRYQPGKLVTFQVESTCWAERHVDTTTKGRAIALRPASRLRRSSRKENNLLGRTAGSSLSTLFELTFTHTQIFGVCVCVCVFGFFCFLFFWPARPRVARRLFGRHFRVALSVRLPVCCFLRSFLICLIQLVSLPVFISLRSHRIWHSSRLGCFWCRFHSIFVAPRVFASVLLPKLIPSFHFVCVCVVS